MNTLVYKIKNKIFRLSKESQKIIRPSYSELIKYKSYNQNIYNKFILSFGAGRCGQNWVAKIFNSHSNWIGTSERFSDFEAFFRYLTFYKLPIDKEGIYQLIELAVKRDFSKYQNTFIASPYFSFGAMELNKRLNPSYLFFNIRDPIKSVESFYRKGWYHNLNNMPYNKTPHIDFSNNLKRSFSRVFPKDDYLSDWLGLTTIGKITWFWAITNKAILDDFNKIKNINKFFIKLNEVDQNYNFYENLSIKFNFKNKMNKKQFLNVIYKAPNKGPVDKYEYRDWSVLEKKECEDILDKIFPHYDQIKTNI